MSRNNKCIINNEDKSICTKGTHYLKIKEVMDKPDGSGYYLIFKVLDEDSRDVMIIVSKNEPWGSKFYKLLDIFGYEFDSNKSFDIDEIVGKKVYANINHSVWHKRLYANILKFL